MTKAATKKTTTKSEQTAPEMAASTMLGDLMRLVIEQAKAMPKSWPEMSESEQQEYIDRAELQIKSSIESAVHIISTQGGDVNLPVLIDTATIKPGKECVVKVKLTHRHDAVKLIGAECLTGVLSVVDTEPFTVDQDLPQGEEDQRGLDLGHEYNDEK